MIFSEQCVSPRTIVQIVVKYIESVNLEDTDASFYKQAPSTHISIL